MGNKEENFKAAFESHSDELFRHATLRVSDRERALELTQETFLRTWEYIQKGQEVYDFRPFLFRTLRHLIIDEYRKHKTTSLDHMVESEDGSVIESLLPRDETNTLEAAMNRLDGKRAVEVIPKLPPAYAEVLTLRYGEGLTPGEIAGLLEESENAVSVRIHRALKKLRELLEPEQTAIKQHE